MDNQKFCLKWDNFQGSVTSLFDNLRQNDELVDITLCCEGQKVRAHKMMLSACSPYFRDVLKDISCQQLVFFMKDTSAMDLRAIVEFMYKGSVNVAQGQLASFIKTAEMLQIRGLSGEEEKSQAPVSAPPSPARQRPPRPPPSPAPEPPPPPPPPAKRRRISTLPAAPAETVQPPQIIDCTLSPDPEPAIEASPSTPGGGLSQHSLPSPAPSPAAYSTSSAQQQRPFQHVGSAVPEPPTPSTSGYDQTDPAYSRGDSYDMKVEKVEMQGGEEDSALGSALEHVAEYEGGEVYEEGYPSLEMGGEGQMDPNAAMGAGGSQPGGPDDGSQKGSYDCQQCGRTFAHARSLKKHYRMHEGATVCPLCTKVSSCVSDLRRHLRLTHNLGDEDVRRLVPTRLTAHQLYGHDQSQQ